MSGKGDKAREMLDQLDRLSRYGYIRGEPRAWICAAIGEKDQAFHYLNEVCDERSPGVVYLKLDPLLDPPRDAPRFDALLRRIGVAD